MLSKAIDSKLNYLSKLKDLYGEKASNDRIIPSQERRKNYLIRKNDQLLQVIKRSILRCGERERCILIREN